MKVKALLSLMIPVTHDASSDPENLSPAIADDLLSCLGSVNAVGMFSYPNPDGTTTVDTSCEISMEIEASEPYEAEFLARERVLDFLALNPCAEHGEVSAIAFPA